MEGFRIFVYNHCDNIEVKWYNIGSYIYIIVDIFRRAGSAFIDYTMETGGLPSCAPAAQAFKH